MTAIIDDTAEAYVWGYPLVAMQRMRATRGATRRGLVARDRLSTAADRAVVGPNNDTLYASGFFDLRRGDLVVDVGAMDKPDRYWSVMLLDAYTHVSYICRRLHGCDGASVRVTFDPSVRPVTDRALDVLAVGTTSVWVLVRVLVDGPDDLCQARAMQARLQVHQQAGPASTAKADGSPARGSDNYFDQLRDALTLDPPAAWHPQPPANLTVLLRDPLPAQIQTAGIEQGNARIARSLGVDRTSNGWGTRSRGADFGNDVAYRAAFAKVSLAGHLPAENRSYGRTVDGATTSVLHFPRGAEPPVDAFWSLSLYGTDMFFVENEISRYSIGDRTPGLNRSADGSLTITIGHERPTDVSNWLPAPASRCFLTLRAYEGRSDVVEGHWFPPDLTEEIP